MGSLTKVTKRFCFAVAFVSLDKISTSSVKTTSQKLLLSSFVSLFENSIFFFDLTSFKMKYFEILALFYYFKKFFCNFIQV